MNKIVFLFVIFVLAIGLPLFLKMYNSIEGYSNYTLDMTTGNFPTAQTEILVQDTYKAIGKNTISNNTSNDIWWHYPIFKLGSYDQITNNIRYPYNPDEGTCMPASMCGALYHDKKISSNYIEPLPPIYQNEGIRVGYFDANSKLVDSLSN
jgi:hypothetical protein